jgi:hypothetical protein
MSMMRARASLDKLSSSIISATACSGEVGGCRFSSFAHRLRIALFLCRNISPPFGNFNVPDVWDGKSPQLTHIIEHTFDP